jgi:ribosomal protein S27AE
MSILSPIPLDPDNVVRLQTEFKQPAPEGRYLVRAPLACSHFNGPFLVDEKAAEVTCGRCKEKLNPMWVLGQLVQKESRWHEHFERYQDEMKRLAERSRTKCRRCGEMTPISRT